MKKAVPVVVRNHGQGLEILAFRHPLAGTQLVKGTIEQDEQYEHAAIRELFEESGLVAKLKPKFMGNLSLQFNQQDWYFYLCDISHVLPETWVYHCQDDGGLAFEFFWYPLNQKPNADWHETFQEALAFIRKYFDLEK
ncbi:MULTISPECIES: NUDIX hydrolase [Acinetobacter]|uniref:NUDIX domain-containing protein n=1 Tax=Acinetobacter corruptisaponis TaxID=3045147 RepID=A0ABY8S1R7_9GAMM|nr:NUDIX domain-containing protein [Acinetobacter sp. KCTC 92772]WHP05623.1 NUDIX domain-containing protein [Acinetobacter sp. KCTC 92772]